MATASSICRWQFPLKASQSERTEITSFPPPSMMTVVGTEGLPTSSTHSLGMDLVQPSCREEPWCGVSELWRGVV